MDCVLGPCTTSENGTLMDIPEVSVDDFVAWVATAACGRAVNGCDRAVVRYTHCLCCADGTLHALCAGQVVCSHVGIESGHVPFAWRDVLADMD